MIHNHFSGLRILVSGASSGIGAAVAKQIANEGGKVALIGRNEERLSSVASDLTGSGHVYKSINLGDFESPDLENTIRSWAEEGGPFTGIFHSAGKEVIAPLQLAKSKTFHEAFDASFFGGVTLARIFIKKGISDPNLPRSLVFMSSVASIRGQNGMSFYSASKGALDAFVRSLAVELAPAKIRVNSIVAGAIETEMHSRLTTNLSEESVSKYKSRHLLGFGRPEDVASAGCFLLSEKSRWITGTSLVVDGGYSCF